MHQYITRMKSSFWGAERFYKFILMILEIIEIIITSKLNAEDVNKPTADFGQPRQAVCSMA